MNSYEITYQKSGELQKIITDDLSKLPENIISIKQLNKNKKRSLLFNYNSSKNIYNFFYELNIILNSNLTILDAISILRKNRYDKSVTEIIESFYKSLVNGKYIYKDLQRFEKVLGKLTIEFIKIGELNGNLKQSINSITALLEQKQKGKKKLIASFTYPLILSISLFISLIAIFNFIVPKFESIYVQYKGDLPLSTQYLLYMKVFFDSYLIITIIVSLIAIFLFALLYAKSTSFKEKLDRFLITKIPLVSNMFLVINSSNFFFSLSTLLKDDHQFFDSLNNSKSLISNSYLLNRISKVEQDIKDGKDISKAFEDSELFDDLTIRLIHTGEKSNNLVSTLSKIDTIYKERLNNTLQNFITIFEPALIASAALFILWLVLAIFTPIWDIGTILK